MRGPVRTAGKRLAISVRMFAVMRALEAGRDPYRGEYKRSVKNAIASAIEALRQRRLITHTNVVADPWKLTTAGRELLALKELGEQRLEERRRRAFARVYGR